MSEFLRKIGFSSEERPSLKDAIDQKAKALAQKEAVDIQIKEREQREKDDAKKQAAKDYDTLIKPQQLELLDNPTAQAFIGLFEEFVKEISEKHGVEMKKQTTIKYGSLSPEEKIEDKEKVVDYYRRKLLYKLPLSVSFSFLASHPKGQYSVEYIIEQDLITLLMADRKFGSYNSTTEIPSLTDALAERIVKGFGYISRFPSPEREDRDGYVNPC